MKNGSTIGLIVAGLAVLVGGAAAGYYYMGGSGADKAGGQPQQSVSTNSNTSSQPPPTSAASSPKLAPAAGEYTAPGAPTIDITESKGAPKPKAQPAAPPPDSEASQTGLDPASSQDNGDNGSDNGSPGDDSAPAATAPPPNSPVAAMDSERPKPVDADTTPSDSGTASPPPPPPPPAASSAMTGPTFNSGLYHVQAGAFQNQKNANTLAGALRKKGYAATTLKQAGGSKDTFVVQVGAYGSRVTADEVVASLQHDGFPASVSLGQTQPVAQQQ